MTHSDVGVTAALLAWFDAQPSWKQHDILNQYDYPTLRTKIAAWMKKDAIAVVPVPQFLAINTVADYYVVAVGNTQNAAEATVMAMLQEEGCQPDSDINILSGPIKSGQAVNIDNPKTPADWRWFRG